MASASSTVVPAKDAHMLFSSMGFPLDLTELMAAERGLTVDKDGFQAMMDRDRKISEAAEAARKGAGTEGCVWCVCVCVCVVCVWCVCGVVRVWWSVWGDVVCE